MDLIAPKAPCIVVVHDDPAVLQSARELILALGYEVSATADLPNTHRFIAETRPDLVLLEAPAQLPETLDLLMQLRLDPETRSIPVLAGIPPAGISEHAQIRLTALACTTVAMPLTRPALEPLLRDLTRPR